MVEFQQFGTGTGCGLEILHQCGKRIKVKSQNVLAVNILTFVEVTQDKLVGTAFLKPLLTI